MRTLEENLKMPTPRFLTTLRHSLIFIENISTRENCSKRWAKTDAILFSLEQSCKLNALNPRDYFKHLVQDLDQGLEPYTPASDTSNAGWVYDLRFLRRFRWLRQRFLAPASADR
jgi:hypothetical protein